ncbi:MAG: Ig-like domain-containing protein [Clostridiaceae bacterium]
MRININKKILKEGDNIKRKVVIIIYIILNFLFLTGCGCGSSIPKAVDDEVTTDFNETISIYALLNDEHSVEITEVTQGELGTVIIKDEYEQLVYTPKENAYGKDTFSYQVSNGDEEVDTATVTVNINPPGSMEVNDDNVYCIEDNSEKIDFIVDNDKTEAIGPLEIMAFTDLKSGTIEKISDSYFFIPDKDFNGEGSFNYTVKDVMGGIAKGFVNVKITPAPDAPEVFDDKVEAFNDETIEIDVVKNDIDVDGDNIYIVQIGDNSSNHIGTMKIKENKLFYTPNKGSIGIDKFSYTINDSSDSALEDTGTITIGVISRENNIEKTINTNEDKAIGFSVIGDGVELKDYPNNGIISVDMSKVLYTPNENFNGEDSFNLYYKNNNNGTNYMKVKVIVKPVNDVPIAKIDEFTVDINSVGNIFNVLSNDTDIDGDNLTIKSIEPNESNVAILENNKIVYSPTKDFQGEDILTYIISDGNGETSTATINITVKDMNHAPIAVDDEFTVQEDSRVNIFNVLDNDTDVDNNEIIIEKIETVDYGSAAIINNKVVYYTAKDFYGEDTITYIISDGNGGNSTATIRVTVNPVNDVPIAVDDEFTVDEDSVDNVFDVLVNDTDIENDNLKITGAYSFGDGTYRIEDNKVIYNPGKNFHGLDGIIYSISDGNGGTNTATIRVTVKPAPLAINDNVTLYYPDEEIESLLVSEYNDEDDSFSIESFTQGEDGEVKLDGEYFYYERNSVSINHDTFTYTIVNAEGRKIVVTVIITIIDEPIDPIDEPIDPIDPIDPLGE